MTTPSESPDASLEHEPFQIVDQISGCPRLRIPTDASLHQHTSAMEEDGKSTTAHYKYEPSFSYRDEGSLTPRKHFDVPAAKESNTPSSLAAVELTATSFLGEVPDGGDYQIEDAEESKRSCDSISDSKMMQRLEESDDDSIPRRLAKQVLLNIGSNIDTLARVLSGPLTASHIRERGSKGFFMTQVMINLHVAVLRDMMELMQTGIECRPVVIYICKSLEMPGVSSVSGPQFMHMPISDKIITVLMIARPFIESFWGDYDDPVYAECHRQLDLQTKLIVRSLYEKKQKSCIFL